MKLDIKKLKSLDKMSIDELKNWKMFAEGEIKEFRSFIYTLEKEISKRKDPYKFKKRDAEKIK